jgi:DNA-binding response OmpR family regulator
MKILIVEDERKIAESLKKGLEAQHYRVDLAFDGPSGLDMALSGSYLLLILDRMLPGLDGIQVIQKLREQGCQTPVLMLTALTRIHERVEGFQAGADDYPEEIDSSNGPRHPSVWRSIGLLLGPNRHSQR